MKGLDMVQGPHWSKILGLFGKGGTLSEVLAKRTQVQLKDKARNLKLFFLKSGTEMPVYLKLVTGELKTRAPQTAARREAEAQAHAQAAQARAQHNSEDGARRETAAPPAGTSGAGGVPLLPAATPQAQQARAATAHQPLASHPLQSLPPQQPRQPHIAPAQPSTTLTPHAAAAAAATATSTAAPGPSEAKKSDREGVGDD